MTLLAELRYSVIGSPICLKPRPLGTMALIAAVLHLAFTTPSHQAREFSRTTV
jgi:hypothetical protein